MLTARGLNKNIRIVSRVVEKESEHKLKIAGAETVVAPNYIGGLRMASVMLRPAVVSFLDVMMRDQSSTIRIESISLPKTSSLVGNTLRYSDIGRKTGLIVIAMKRANNEKYIYNPNPDTRFEAEDTLIVMGDLKQVETLRYLVEK